MSERKSATEAAYIALEAIGDVMEAEDFLARQVVGIPEGIPDEHTHSFYEGVMVGLMFARVVLKEMGPQHTFTREEMEAVFERLQTKPDDDFKIFVFTVDDK